MRHAGSAATRASVVPRDEPAPSIEDALPDLRTWAGRSGRVLTSTAQRCRVADAHVHDALRPWDLGSWSGRPLADLPPQELVAWRSDPDWSGHGGESLRALHARVTGALPELAAGPGRTVAVTHGAVVQVAVVVALDAPLEAFWSVDAPPATCTELHHTSSGWRLCRLADRSARP